MNRNKFLFLAAPLIALLMLFAFSSCEGGEFYDPGHLAEPGLSGGGSSFGGGGSSKEDCSMCDGDGDCFMCEGSGELFYGTRCTFCGGSGKCYLCDGKGKY